MTRAQAPADPPLELGGGIAPTPGREHLGSGFVGRHVLSMSQYDRTDLEVLFDSADAACAALATGRPGRPLAGRLLVSAFFDNSTRTRLAHEAAMCRLGGSVTGFADPSATRAGGITQESHEDIARMLSLYGDVVVVRHPVTGWPDRAAANSAGALFINGGDGLGEHPTQAMVDLYTLRQRFGRIDGLRILLVNDLKMRCARSLLIGLRHFDCKVYAVAADGVPPNVPEGQPVTMCESMRDLLPEVDVVYSSPTVTSRPDATGRDARPVDESQLGPVTLNWEILESSGNRDLTVMHPLPRRSEVATDVDGSQFDGYLQQAANGVPVRMGLLRLMFAA
jgi:aspartate carbamoyltransferase catalytic subunit